MGGARAFALLRRHHTAPIGETAKPRGRAEVRHGS